MATLVRSMVCQGTSTQQQSCLCSLCCGTLAYVLLVWGNRCTPQTLINISFDPKILCHLFSAHGQQLSWWRQTRCKTHCCDHMGWRIDPMLQNMEGGHCICPFATGLYKLRHHLYLELRQLVLPLNPTLAPSSLHQISNTTTTSTQSGALIFSYLTYLAHLPPIQAPLTTLTCIPPNGMPSTAVHCQICAGPWPQVHFLTYYQFCLFWGI